MSLRFEHVTFTYPDHPHPALRDVDIEVTPGSFTLVTGPTGSGKSTLLRAANGLIPHFSGGTYSGRVIVDDLDTVEHPPRELAGHIAFVPQDAAASFVLDLVEDELAYGMENLGVDPAMMRRRIEEMLDLLAIEPLRDRSVRTLSGGEQQRVAIAAALAAGPSIVVLDEPTSQLDPQGAEDVLAALQRLVHDHGMTVLLAEHRLERVAGFADAAIGVQDGVVTIGEPREIIGDQPGGPPVTRLGRALGWDPLPLTVRDARAHAKNLELPQPIARPASTAADASNPTIIEVKRLAAKHGDRQVLDSVNMTIGAGEIVALMGRNGAGKTTLLRTIAGVHEPSSGSVTVLGAPPDPGISVALCPQDPDTILFADTVADEVRATSRAHRLDVDPDTILGDVGIQHLRDRHPRDLSAGQRLLVATAAVIATGAPAFLLDEPTRGLDPESKEVLATSFRRHADKGTAVLFSTHDVELVAAIADRVIMIAGGDVIADGDPASVLGDSRIFAPQMTRVFGPGWLTPAAVLEALGR